MIPQDKAVAAQSAYGSIQYKLYQAGATRRQQAVLQHRNAAGDVHSPQVKVGRCPVFKGVGFVSVDTKESIDAVGWSVRTRIHKPVAPADL